MSKSSKRYPLADAAVQAMSAHDVISKHSARVVIAGSIRRGRADVGDIDLVVLDETNENPWQHQVIDAALFEIGWFAVAGGEKIARFQHHDHAPLDLYFATLETWGITLLVRTGSAAHNIRIAQLAGRRTPARKLSVARGILNTAGYVVASKTEDEIFHELGLGVIAPSQREAPELEHLVRVEEPS